MAENEKKDAGEQAYAELLKKLASDAATLEAAGKKLSKHTPMLFSLLLALLVGIVIGWGAGFNGFPNFGRPKSCPEDRHELEQAKTKLQEEKQALYERHLTEIRTNCSVYIDHKVTCDRQKTYIWTQLQLYKITVGLHQKDAEWIKLMLDRVSRMEAEAKIEDDMFQDPRFKSFNGGEPVK